MAPHSSTLAWKIPWTEEPGGLQSMGSLRVGHEWATSLSLFTFMHWKRKGQPTPMFLPCESQGRGSLVGCHQSFSSFLIMCLPLWFNTYLEIEMSSFPYVFLERISRLVRNLELCFYLYHPQQPFFCQPGAFCVVEVNSGRQMNMQQYQVETRVSILWNKSYSLKMCMLKL